MMNKSESVTEEWKPVVGYEGIYEVSNKGNVKSLSRFKYCGHKGSKQLTKEKMLTISNDRLGYRRVNLSKDGHRRKATVHRVVALAFLDNNLGKKEVNHKDGNKNNNNVENLEWSTRSENMLHAFSNDLKYGSRGENNVTSKLKNKDVIEIRSMRTKGYKLREIAEKFKISIASVGYIVNFKTWKEV